MKLNARIALNLLVVSALLMAALGQAQRPASAVPAADAVPSYTPIAPIVKTLERSNISTFQQPNIPNAFPPLKALPVQDQTASEQDVLIIVRLSDPDVINYSGGIKGLASTTPGVTGSKQFDAHTPASQAYLKYLNSRQATFVAQVKKISPSAKVVAQYQAALNGVALRLPTSDIARIRALPDVVAIYPSEVQHVDTDRGPQWIGAPSAWIALGGQSAAGEGVVIGVIDTGIWSPNPLTPTLQYTMPHPSFVSDASAFGGAYTFPFTSVTGINFNQKFGVCSSPQASDGTFLCNDKIIGGYWYNGAGLGTATEFKSPLDNSGHGTHTASTAGGNRTTASVGGAPVISGVAPRARLIVYKVCWDGDPNNSDDGGCGSADSLSAINQAILDGVNVINYSIGGGANPTGDPVELAFLNARAAGIFVSASAGNDGPITGTVAHLSPWVNTSAAILHDRTKLATVDVTSTFCTPPTCLRGASATGGITGRAVLAPQQFTGDTYPGQCSQPYTSGTFQPTDVVVCRRGLNARVEKSRNVQLGGAGGFILINASDNQGLALDAHWLPAAHLEKNKTAFSTAGEDLVNYLLTAVPTNVVTITLSGGAAFTRTGDVLATFSSRGPSSLNQIKPDNAAPGVEILAGVSPQNSENWALDGDLFEYYNGTSMSSPHTAGAGALLKALHPDWTAAEIQAALMTSAVPILNEDGLTPATPFEQGAGRLNLSRAMNPGLLFDVPVADYYAYITGTKPIEALNIPSFAQTRCALTCAWTRTAENVLTTTATYTWTAVTNTPGFTVTLDQPGYVFAPGAVRAFTVTANVSALPADGVYAFARVILHETATGIEVQMPLAVIKAGTAFDAAVDISTPRDSGGETFQGVVGNNYSGVTGTLYGLADPLATAAQISSDDDSDPTTNPLDPAYGWFLYTDTLPSNLGRYIVSTGNSTAADLDLYLLYDSGGDGYDLNTDVIAHSAGGTANERLELLNLQSWSGRQILIAVYNLSGGGTAGFDLTRWHVVPTIGTLQLTGLPSTLNAGQTITPLARYRKAMLPGATYYGLINIGTLVSETQVAQVLVNLERTASEVTKSVSPTVVNAGDIVTYTIVIANQDTMTRTFALTDPIPAGLAYVPGSISGLAVYDSGLNAILLSTAIPGKTPSPNYVIDDSLSNPNLVHESPTGGFLNLANYGAPAARADEQLYFYENLGCPFAFYDSANVTPNSFAYSPNGLIGPRNGISPTIPGLSPSPIPTAANPNAFIAVDWSNLSISTTLGFTNAGRLGYLLYRTTPKCPTDMLWAFQFHRLHSKTNPAKVMDVQYVYDFADPDVHWVQYGNVAGTWGAAAGASDVVGVEDFAGALGVSYTGPITTGLILRYRREVFPSQPVTVTFQAQLTPNAFETIINTARYRVDVPYTTIMDVIAVVEHVLMKMYLPLIRK